RSIAFRVISARSGTGALMSCYPITRNPSYILFRLSSLPAFSKSILMWTEQCQLRRQLWLLVFLVVLLGCPADRRFDPPPAENQLCAESKQLRQMVDEYFEEFLKMAPLFATSIGDDRYDDQLAIVISEEQRVRRRGLYQRYQNKMAAFPRDRLDPDDQLILA